MALLLMSSFLLSQAAFGQNSNPDSTDFEPREITPGHWGSGQNGEGQVGTGVEGDPRNPTGVQVDSLVLVNESTVMMAAGENHHYFIDGDGVLWGTGRNNAGQLGDTLVTGDNALNPVEIAQDVIYVNAGRNNGMYITSDNSLYLLGQYYTEENHYEPLLLADNAVAVDGGLKHVLYLTEDGTLYGVGGNQWGELGIGSEEDQEEPVQVDTEVASIHAGWEHSLYLKEDGTLWAMGFNERGKLGIGSEEDTGHNTPTQVEVEGGTGVIHASAKAHNSFMVTDDGTLWGFGSSFRGTFGDGTSVSGAGADEVRNVSPVRVDEQGDVIKVAAGARHVLFIREDNTLWVAGHNNAHQLGFPGESLSEYRHIANNVEDISAGGSFSLALGLGSTEVSVDPRDNAQLPRQASLDQNYPNPFNPTTNITYTLPENSTVTLEVFNMLGQKVATLYNGRQSAGVQTVTFDATNLSSGMYMYRLQTGSFVETKSMMLVK